VRKSEEKKEARTKIKIVYASNENFFGNEAELFFERWKEESEITKIFGNELDRPTLINFFQSKGIFEPVSLLHLKNGEKLDKETAEKLCEFLKKPPDTVVLFIEYVGDLSERSKNIKGAWKEIITQVKPENMNPHSAKSYILKRTNEKGIEISDGALLELESWAGRDLYLLPSAMDILCLAAQESKQISEKDVSDLLGTGESATIFELQDKFLSKDESGISEAIRKIENDASASPITFVSNLSREMTLFAKIYSLQKKGLSIDYIKPEDVDKDLQFFKLKKIKDNFSKWNEKQVLNVLSKLAVIDRAIKGDPVEPWTSIELNLLQFLRK